MQIITIFSSTDHKTKFLWKFLVHNMVYCAVAGCCNRSNKKNIPQKRLPISVYHLMKVFVGPG